MINIDEEFGFMKTNQVAEAFFFNFKFCRRFEIFPVKSGGMGGRCQEPAAGKQYFLRKFSFPGWTNVCQAVAGVGCIAAFVNKMILPVADISLGWIRKTEVSVVLAVVTVPDDFNGRVVQCFKYTFRIVNGYLCLDFVRLFFHGTTNGNQLGEDGLFPNGKELIDFVGNCLSLDH